ncbi:MAG TPA: deiodinase-like protein [Cyclobacteriaceae bacterium]|nr:deiodinase-like protein [Cyclobacteriaceae bacterium]
MIDNSHGTGHRTGYIHVKRPFVFALCAIVLLLNASCASQKALPPPGNTRVQNPASQALISGWEQLGFKKGQQVPDFTLFSEDKKPFKLSTELKKGKPVVLINASYTCDVSRNNLESILDIVKTYRKAATFVIIYTIEAHPSDEPSPYSPYQEILIAKDNIRDKVEARQPKTYAERQALANRWKTMYRIPMMVLVDSADNLFWTNFGQAPNMVYVIAPDRKVLFKQAWFNKSKLTSELHMLDSPGAD